MSGVRFYRCPECGRLLVTAADGGPSPHVCEREAPAYGG